MWCSPRPLPSALESGVVVVKWLCVLSWAPGSPPAGCVRRLFFGSAVSLAARMMMQTRKTADSTSMTTKATRSSASSFSPVTSPPTPALLLEIVLTAAPLVPAVGAAALFASPRCSSTAHTAVELGRLVMSMASTEATAHLPGLRRRSAASRSPPTRALLAAHATCACVPKGTVTEKSTRRIEADSVDDCVFLMSAMSTGASLSAVASSELMVSSSTHRMSMESALDSLAGLKSLTCMLMPTLASACVPRATLLWVAPAGSVPAEPRGCGCVTFGGVFGVGTARGVLAASRVVSLVGVAVVVVVGVASRAFVVAGAVV